MAHIQISEDTEKLKQGLIKVLECIATISSSAAVVNPIFGVAGSLIRVVLQNVDDDESIQTLRREFGSMNQALDELSLQNRGTLQQIMKDTLDVQYSRVEENLRNQFRKFMEVVEAQSNKEHKRDDFEESYTNDLGDQNLHTLYDGVMGKPKLFSRPILEVYMTHSQGDRRVMEHLCTRLTYLFCIGLIALMGNAAITGDDEKDLSKEWAEKMKNVQEKMQEVLRKCK